MDDGPSFVSPNGSFENVNIGAQEQKAIASSNLNDIEVTQPGAQSKRSTATDYAKQQELIEQLQAANEL